MPDNKEKSLVPVAKENGWTWREETDTENWIAPPTDVYETGDEFVLIVNLPGVERNHIKVQLERDEVVVMGRINYHELSKRHYIVRENPIGHYYRKFSLTGSIDTSLITAKYENGQLTIMLPKRERTKQREIPIA
jgi:HSP20 family protein